MRPSIGRVLGLSLIVLISTGSPLWADEAQNIELNVGTTRTQPLVLPPVPTMITITEGSDPAATADQPLSLMGQTVLDAVCAAWIPVDLALKTFPDLSLVHIRRSCPQALKS